MAEWLAKFGATLGLASFVLIALAFALPLVRRTIVRFRRKRTAAGPGETESVRRVLDEFLVELERTTAEIEARLEVQFERLKSAENALDEKLRGVGLSATSAPRIPASAPTENATHPSLTIPQAVRPAIPREKRERAMRRVGRFERAEPGTQHASRLADVYRLADSGESAAAIAEKTRLALGEVEILLSLRDFRAN